MKVEASPGRARCVHDPRGLARVLTREATGRVWVKQTRDEKDGGWRQPRREKPAWEGHNARAAATDGAVRHEHARRLGRTVHAVVAAAGGVHVATAHASDRGGRHGRDASVGLPVRGPQHTGHAKHGLEAWVQRRLRKLARW